MASKSDLDQILGGMRKSGRKGRVTEAVAEIDKAETAATGEDKVSAAEKQAADTIFGPEKEEAPPHSGELPPEAPAAPPVKAAETPAAPREVKVEDVEKPPAPPAEPPKTTQPREVPVEVLMSERQERQRLQQQLADQQRELAELKARQQPAAPQPPVDPEPDRKLNPIEWDAWKIRDLERKLDETNNQLRQVREPFEQMTQQRQVEAATVQFDGILKNLRAQYAVQNPDIEARREYLRNLEASRQRFLGVPEEQIPAVVDEAERRLYALAVNNKRHPVEFLHQFAEANGYRAGAPAAAAPAATPEAQVRQEARVAAATRTVGTMPGSAPPRSREDNEMTAEKYAKMSMAQRRKWKEDNPDFDLGDFFGGEEASSGLL